MNIIFFDIDGTLANGIEVPKSAKEAIRKLRENQNIIFISSGRALPYVKKYFYQYANGYITNNGRLATMGCCEVLHDAPIDKDLFDKVISAIYKTNAGASFFSKDKGFYIGNEKGYRYLSEIWDDGFLAKQNPDGIIYSFDVWFENEQMKKDLEKELGNRCLLNPHGPHPSADVTVLGSDKSDAIKSVARYLNVPIENTYAFGDGINDISMLKVAGHGIAMGNARKETKQVADYITTDINDDGVYNACKHFNLI